MKNLFMKGNLYFVFMTDLRFEYQESCKQPFFLFPNGCHAPPHQECFKCVDNVVSTKFCCIMTTDPRSQIAVVSDFSPKLTPSQMLSLEIATAVLGCPDVQTCLEKLLAIAIDDFEPTRYLTSQPRSEIEMKKRYCLALTEGRILSQIFKTGKNDLRHFDEEDRNTYDASLQKVEMVFDNLISRRSNSI